LAAGDAPGAVAPVGDDAAPAAWVNALDPVLVTDPVRGLVVDANAAACALFGLTVEQLREVDCLALRDPADKRWGAALERRARTGSFQGELSWRRGDGSTFPAEVTCSLFQADDGIHAAIQVRELTSRFPQDDPGVYPAEPAVPDALRRQADALRGRLGSLALSLYAAATELAECPDSNAACWRRIATAADALAGVVRFGVDNTVEAGSYQAQPSPDRVTAHHTAHLASRSWRLAVAVVLADELAQRASHQPASDRALVEACQTFVDTLESHLPAGERARRAESS